MLRRASQSLCLARPGIVQCDIHHRRRMTLDRCRYQTQEAKKSLDFCPLLGIWSFCFRQDRLAVKARTGRCAAPGRFLQGGPLIGSEGINRDAKRKAFSLTHSGTSTYGLVLDFKRLLVFNLLSVTETIYLFLTVADFRHSSNKSLASASYLSP